MAIRIGYKTDNSITIDTAALQLEVGTKFYFTVKQYYDNDPTDATAIIDKTITTTVLNQTSVIFEIDSDSDYANISPDATYIFGIIYQTPDATPADKWISLELTDNKIIFPRTVKNERPN